MLIFNRGINGLLCITADVAQEKLICWSERDFWDVTKPVLLLLCKLLTSRTVDSLN